MDLNYNYFFLIIIRLKTILRSKRIELSFYLKIKQINSIIIFHKVINYVNKS